MNESVAIHAIQTRLAEAEKRGDDWKHTAQQAENDADWLRSLLATLMAQAIVTRIRHQTQINIDLWLDNDDPALHRILDYPLDPDPEGES